MANQGSEAVSVKGVIAADPKGAAKVGAAILAQGGTAMDAAAAASLACCMLQPQSTGVGGYACTAMVMEGRTGKTWAIDANSTAPAAAHEGMYEIVPTDPSAKQTLNEWEYGISVKGNANLYGPLAVAVPGMMAGMGIVHERWGRLPWTSIVAPSQRLLEDGFPYATTAGAINRLESVIRQYPATAAHLLQNGRVPGENDIWHRPDMEKTLARIAKAGWRDFYEGELARTIASEVQKAGGIMTAQDMAGFAPRVTETMSVDYRGARVEGALPPNGCITAMQTLAMLNYLDLPATDTPEYWHLMIEATKLAWRDRIQYLADPDFADVPVARLLSADYAAGRIETVRRFPWHVDRLDATKVVESPHCTLHVSAADAEGNLAAMTITQGFSFGSCWTVPGTGLILGHGMCRFDPRPGLVNSVAAKKRPLNNMCPLIVRTPDRDIAIGLPGGRKLVSAMTRGAQLIVDRGATARQAAVAPRYHVETIEPAEVEKTVAPETMAALAAMCHNVRGMDSIAGCMNGVERIKATGQLRAGSSLPNCAIASDAG